MVVKVEGLDLDSPALTGTPSLPTGTTGVTQTASDNSTKIATTAYADERVQLNNVTATTDPASTDGVLDGYAVGSMWVNVTDDKSFICVDATSTTQVVLTGSIDPGAVAQVDTVTPTAVSGGVYDTTIASTLYTYTAATTTAQVDTYTPDVVNSGVYECTLAGTLYSFTADATMTVAEVTLGMTDAINAGAGAETAVDSTTHVTITADVAGTAFTHTTSGTGTATAATTTANVPIATVADITLGITNAINAGAGAETAADTGTTVTITADVAGTAFTTTVAGTGTSSVATTTANVLGTTVVGVGTLFTTELVVGQSILVSAETRVVDTITDNLNLTVTAAFTDVANDATPEKTEDNAVWNQVDAAGGISNIVEDTTPQLGGMLDINTFGFGDGTLELLSFVETASAVNELTITNAATAGSPSLSATGGDVDISLNLISKGTGTVQANGSDVLIASDVGVSVQSYNATNVLDADVTYGLLDTNGDVGTGAGQLAIGNHNHDNSNPTFNDVIVDRIEVNEVATFDLEFDNGNSGTTKTIDWNNGNKQKMTMTGDCTISFTNPPGVGNFLIRIIQNATGTYTTNWPTAKWSGGGGEVDASQGANDEDIFMFYFDGTTYYGSALLDFV